jgi:Zn-finger nucleic acid-binding protein
MRERERADIVMDVCPDGHGIWLDAGELERLTAERRDYARTHPGYRYEDDEDDEWHYRRRSNGATGSIPRKRKGFLSSLMEGITGEGPDD